ncbi:hypothetical protein [Mucilaginibacter sp. SJ]|uniref:hypothetical protein n=1 Tax=Mucilaginibacter sp. SJ TaxID=3029053 RepID=UPI0023A91472|nr:hypothetical protein [Mucilaginibacter sp. SJ]WEA00670.1 hypothetical protein MusilaSJ_24755 [Mucilaginibacter sp. SJ]
MNFFRISKLTLTVLALFSIKGFAQTNLKLPEVVPASPQSRAFQQYGDYPVSYNTGVPDISIPLYTVKSGELEMPIVLRYHADGIKPYDPDLSNIGAGWTLDVGGLVSRTIKGRGDEQVVKPSPFLTAFDINQNTLDGAQYLNDILGPSAVKDTEHDIFSYSFLGKNGNFAIDDQGNGQFIAYPYPFIPYKFNIQTAAPGSSQTYRSIAGIDITDDNGLNFKFGHNNIETVATGSLPRGATGWYLEDVLDPLNNNLLHISYDAVPEFQTLRQDIGTIVSGDAGRMIVNSNCAGPSTSTGWTTSSQGTGTTYNVKALNTITFRDGYIKFNQSSDKRLLLSMVVYNKNNEIIRSFVFNRDVFPGSTSLNRFTSLEIKNGSGGLAEQYSFTYNTQVQIADNDCSVDAWGYCNGTGGQFKYTSRTIGAIYNAPVNGGSSSYNIQVGNASFDPVEQYAKRYILEKITYPTGGTTEFSYQVNKYLDNQVIKDGGGLRIQSILSKDNTGNSLVKTYEYDPGFIYYSLGDPNNFTKSSFNIFVNCQINGQSDCLSNAYYQLRTRQFANGWNSDLGPNRVFYNRVTEYTGDQTNNNGKTVFNYTYQNPDGTSTNSRTESRFISDIRNWGNGLLHYTEIFKKTGAGNYSKIKDITDNYSFADIKILNNLSTSLYYSYQNVSPFPLSIYNFRKDNCYFMSLPVPNDVLNYTISTGAYFKSSSEENVYTDNGTVNTLVQYEHGNPLNYYVTRQTSTDSRGLTKINTMAYPQDKTDAVSVAMTGVNKISPVLEQSGYKTSISAANLLQSTRTVYSDWGSGLFAPLTIDTQTGNAPYESRVHFQKYDDQGNVQSVSKEAGAKELYVFGYGGSYPIARILNSDYSTVETALGGAGAVKSFRDNVSPTDAAVNAFLAPLRSSASLAGAQVTTYTYLPLVGMKTVTDAKGETMYYEYDNFQRLINIKNKDLNIIKHFDYHYQNQ